MTTINMWKRSKKLITTSVLISVMAAPAFASHLPQQPPAPPKQHHNDGSNNTGALVTGAILGAVLTTVINNLASN